MPYPLWTDAPGEHRWMQRRRGVPHYVGDAKVCRRCLRAMPPDLFTVDRKRTDGRAPWCSDCTTEGNRRRRVEDIEKVRAQNREAQRRWRQRNHRPYSTTPEGRRRQAARARLNRAVHAGRIERPDVCSVCGRGGRIVGHHHRGYEGDAALDVQWLCHPCHSAAH